MGVTTVIIHGWSDSSQSFQALKNYLIKMGAGTVKTILYADYESREDHLTFPDIVDGLHDQFIKQGIIDDDGKKLTDLNIICHSTGGLVIRHWIQRYYGSEDMAESSPIKVCPVKKIVMLAPANFGSPLAHRGKSFFSSLVKGRRKFGDFLETGKRILEGLELGSPYQWHLAQADLIQKKPYFNRRQIQVTILVGIKGYDGAAKLVNKPGTDGTVIIAGTSLDTAKLCLDFSKPMKDSAQLEYNPYQWAVEDPAGDFAFGVLEGLNHGSIVAESSNPESLVCQLLTEALAINTAKQFEKFTTRVDTITKETYAKTAESKFQQFLVHAVDDQGVSIEDFTVDFFIWKGDMGTAGGLITKDRLSKKELEYSDKANDILSAQFHTHTVDLSHRSFLVNLDKIKLLISEARAEFGAPVVLSMRLFVPRIDDGISYEVDNLQNIVIHHSDKKISGIPTFFYENTTTLLEMKVNRKNTYVSVGVNAIKH